MRTNLIQTKLTFALVFFFITLLACNAFAAPATPTSAPTPTSIPTAIPLSGQIKITKIYYHDSGKSPDYTIDAENPAILDNPDRRLDSFNTEMHAFAQGLIEDFKKNLAQNPITPVAASSYLDVKFNLVSPSGNIWSIKFDTEGYLAGAAHPYHLSYSFNYDLEKGKDIALSDLFLPGADYLGTISQYCTARLKARNIGFTDTFIQGADPKPENYKNWNITADGLLITFDEYQVAAYAAGPQVMTVPYSELKSLIDPKGPLGSFVK